jgi:hypothetical protein
MLKSISLLSVFSTAALLITGCATASPQDYLATECKDLRALVEAQDQAASVRGVEFVSDRNMEEIRQTSGSPWAGRSRTRGETELREERQAIREAYRRKGCKG